MQYLISCEHATCAVPEAYRELFIGHEEELGSSSGWEPGALNLAQSFSMRYHTPLVHGDVTRLLIHLGHDGEDRWSRFSNRLPEATRLKLADRHERPFRTQLLQRIKDAIKRGEPLLHLLVHTSPEIDGRVLIESFADHTTADEIATAWRARLRESNIEVMHLRNTTPTALESCLIAAASDHAYHPLRLSVAQSYFLEARPRRWDEIRKLLASTLDESLTQI